jgi:quinoprotein glucose dehydrogenase
VQWWRRANDIDPESSRRMIQLRRARILILGTAILMYLQGTGAALAADPQSSREHGAELYKTRCSLCHGPELKGVVPMFPSLIGVTGRVSDADIKKQIRNGKGRMLPFPDLSDDDLNSLVLFLKTQTPDAATKPSVQGGSK